MKTVNIQAAKTHLSRLVEQACAGEEIVISCGNVPMVRLVPVGQPARRRSFGAHPELGPIPVTFDDPLPDEALVPWELVGCDEVDLRSRGRLPPREGTGAQFPVILCVLCGEKPTPDGGSHRRA